jgi:hypothetical protein
MRLGAICERTDCRRSIPVYRPFQREGAAGACGGFTQPWRCDPLPNHQQSAGHPEAIPILATDLEPGGNLKRISFALPHRLVTANEVCVLRAVARLKQTNLQQIRERICATIRQN